MLDSEAVVLLLGLWFLFELGLGLLTELVRFGSYVFPLLGI